MRFGVTPAVVAIGLYPLLVLAYPSRCDPWYGQPNEDDCRRLVTNFSFAASGSHANRGAVHIFVRPGIDRPDEVSGPQWAHQINIPKFWSPRKLVAWPFRVPCYLGRALSPATPRHH